jgi:predicted RNase H-like HicB family nuclease
MAENVRDTLNVDVIFSTDDEEYGPHYIARCKELGLTTGGRTLDELTENLREALAVTLEDTDTVSKFNLVANPTVILIIKMPSDYAKTA